MEHEPSLFESSEMLATFFASTPLLAESWKLCSRANAVAQRSFVVDEIGGVTYVAFSGVQALESIWASLVALEEAAKGIFLALEKVVMGEEWKEPVMVHGGFLQLFMSIYNTPLFQNQMFEIMQKGKPIVFTGHSLGGALASLSSLWLLSLSHDHSISSPLPLLCITFGSPLLGNQSLSQAILQERWGGNFCNVVSKHDIFPRLLFAPLAQPVTAHIRPLLKSCGSSYFSRIREESELFNYVLAHLEESEMGTHPSFWPFGNFMFCSNGGAVCIDGGKAVVKLLHLMFVMGSPSSSFEDHLKYGEYVGKVSLQFLKRKDFMEEELSESNYEAGVALALQSSEITTHEPVTEPAKECLKMAKRMGRTPNLNSAALAIGLSKITPLRAQIEWYQVSCDESHGHMGYYDAFKMRDASKRDFKVNLNRIKLGKFWDQLIEMLENNQLPHDFNKRAKWVNASQFYKLLVEPLDIAEYYRSGMHREKGQYMKYGRERRYEIFDRWWRERTIVSEELDSKRSKFASLTQDSCFWARVEEAKDWLENVRSESDSRKLSFLWNSINEFDQYARTLIERKEVSKDVVAKNSTYSLWAEELRRLKLQLQYFPPSRPDFLD